MHRLRVPRPLQIRRAFFLAAVLWLAGGQPATAQDADAVSLGEYLFYASGGCGCHTDYAQDGAPMAGGRGLKTPFGTFYSTNITADRETGIGTWDDADFLRAMREGVGPSGQHYFPVFPYTSFSKMVDSDLLAIKAYLFSLPPVKRANTPHDVWPPFGWRFGVGPWKWINFEVKAFAVDASRSAAWNRGAYLVEAVAHCTECHTPRNLMGALRRDLWFAGSVDGPEGELAPNITPDADTGIGKWSDTDLAYYLETGFKPDGDDTQGLMAQVIEHGFTHLTREDRSAIAEYVLSLPPIHNAVKAKE